MEPKLALPRQPSSAPLLVVSVLLGLLLSPVVERALERWMPATATQQKSGGNDSGDRSTSDLQTMWE